MVNPRDRKQLDGTKSPAPSSQPDRSPLEVPGVSTQVTLEEILSALGESRGREAKEAKRPRSES